MVTGTWKRVLQDRELQRSSHVVSAVGGHVYVFGGELVPREPRDNKLFDIDVEASAQIQSVGGGGSGPSPRVGSASTTLNGKLYLFSGRGGLAMRPVEEHGKVHEYDPTTSTWAVVEPADSSLPYPPARSYHCMTSDQHSTLFLHAGCPENGRLSDLWSFDVKSKTWTELSEAPAPPRGGTSIAYLDQKLYRMNGFDGKTEQGGSLEVYDIASKSWSSSPFTADGEAGPEARSVGVLVPLVIGGRKTLATFFGERDPSSLGHAGAGKMLSDWWVYDIADGKWEKGVNNGSEAPAPRGWFDADGLQEREVAVVGGLSESNERLDDVWILSF